MAEEDKVVKETSSPVDTGERLVFISHDSRDAEIAKAFANLLKASSAGVLKTFRSSDKEGLEGIEYGDEWYRRLMANLEVSSDVVCLFTARSIDRPWILYEAGVAKGKLNTRVLGVAISIPLDRVNTGPFYQFQNCGDDEDSLIKLVMQLCKRNRSLDPDPEVVRAQVKSFSDKIAKLVSKGNEKPEIVGDNPAGMLYEELKASIRILPSMIVQSVKVAFQQELERIANLPDRPVEDYRIVVGEDGVARRYYFFRSERRQTCASSKHARPASPEQEGEAVEADLPLRDREKTRRRNERFHSRGDDKEQLPSNWNDTNH